MWYFVGLAYAFYAGLVALYWKDLTPQEAPAVPWMIAGMMCSVFIAFVLCVRIDLKEVRERRGS